MFSNVLFQSIEKIIVFPCGHIVAKNKSLLENIQKIDIRI